MGGGPPRSAAEIEAAVAADDRLVPGRPVLVLFSGGRDSTCLLDLAVRIAGPASVGALHVNYGLRAGAALEERHCEAVCDTLGVALAIERPSGPPGSGNRQAWAREIRYATARRLAGDGDVAAGHTADDQLETVLYRLISSPSRRALLGMAPRAGTLIRPLLALSREETTTYCSERGLTWRDDPTNSSRAYVRNRIRHELIPLLAELHPGAGENVLALAAVLREESEVLEAAVDRVLGADAPTDRRADTTLAELRALPRGLARLVLQRLADGAIEGPAAGVASRLDEVLGMGETAMLDLPGGVRARTRDGVLGFERTPRLRR